MLKKGKLSTVQITLFTLSRVQVDGMMLGTLPVSIIPALYPELVLVAGGTRELYSPYVEVMVEFVWNVVRLGVMVVAFRMHWLHTGWGITR